MRGLQQPRWAWTRHSQRIIGAITNRFKTCGFCRFDPHPRWRELPACRGVQRLAYLTGAVVVGCVGSAGLAGLGVLGFSASAPGAPAGLGGVSSREGAVG